MRVTRSHAAETRASKPAPRVRHKVESRPPTQRAQLSFLQLPLGLVLVILILTLLGGFDPPFDCFQDWPVPICQ